MAVEFLPYVVGPLQTNCYLVWDPDTKAAAIIDPGGDRERISSGIDSLGLRVEWILLTHGHFDHSFCAASLAQEYGARTGMHEDDVEQLTGSLSIAEMFYDLGQYVPVKPTDLLVDGQVIRLGESEIRVLRTPGHSRGGLCFVTDAGVFCGDTIFAGSIGRTDFPGGSFEDLMETIRTRILALDDDTQLFPGHGPATTVGDERKSNPFLS